jgi:hypothetical protein
VADAIFHMAVGMGAGTMLAAPRLIGAWRRGAPVAGPTARLLIATYALGFFAIAPNLMTTLGAPAAVHHAWWSNIFVLHGVIDRRWRGGLLIGELAVAAQFVAQYLLILAGIYRARRRPGGGGSPSSLSPDATTPPAR